MRSLGALVVGQDKLYIPALHVASERGVEVGSFRGLAENSHSAQGSTAQDCEYANDELSTSFPT